MKYFFLIICLSLLSNCIKSEKVEYLCGDHTCKNKKERQAYFERTLIVEYKINKDEKNVVPKSYKEIITENKPKINIFKNKKIKKSKKSKIKTVKIPDNKSIKKEERKKIDAPGKYEHFKIFKIKREKDNKYLSRNLKFENLKNKLLKKASVKDFPDINDFPY